MTVRSILKPVELVTHTGSKRRTFTFSRVAGHSTFSTVWQAHETRGKQSLPVALKIYRPEALNPASPALTQENGYGQWSSEKQLTGQPKHRHLANIRQVGAGLVLDQAGREHLRAFSVIDWIPGPTLKDAVNDYLGPHAKKRAFDGFCMTAFCEGLLASLDTLHRRHLLYTDIKPENIILKEPNHCPVLLDLGSVFDRKGTLKAFSTNDLFPSPELEHVTEPGINVREQRKRLRALTPASDLYSTAALFYTMHAWSLKFQLGFEVPTPVTRLINRCLEPNPKARPQSVTEALEILHA